MKHTILKNVIIIWDTEIQNDNNNKIAEFLKEYNFSYVPCEYFINAKMYVYVLSFIIVLLLKYLLISFIYYGIYFIFVDINCRYEIN